MIIFILILFLGSTLEISIYELPQFSSIEVRGTSYIYLNIANYEKDEIYIDISGYGTQKYSSGEIEYYLDIQFEYFFSNSNSDIDFQSNTFSIKSSVGRSSSGSYVTNNYSISLSEKKKYLLIKIIGHSYDSYKITHTKINPMWTAYIIGGIFGLILIIALFCWVKDCIEKRRLNKKCKNIQPLVPDNQTLTTGYNSQISNPPNYAPQSSPGYIPQGQPEYNPPSQQQYIPSSTPINQI
jgi:hypothetical protein